MSARDDEKSAFDRRNEIVILLKKEGALKRGKKTGAKERREQSAEMRRKCAKQKTKTQTKK